MFHQKLILTHIHISSWQAFHPSLDAVTVEPLYENGTLCSQKAVLIAESTQQYASAVLFLLER